MHAYRWSIAATLVIALTGCVGDIGDRLGTQQAGLCQSPQPGSAPLRRMSNAEYRNTITDLLGSASKAEEIVSSFTSETESLGFRNSAKFLTVSSLQAQEYMDAAEELGKVAAADSSLLPCTPSSGSERDCASSFIKTFGRKAYRRPLTDAEVKSYEAIYDIAATEDGFAGGIEWIVFSMLQSPHFLYRVEFGAASSEPVTKPTQFEMASRLSYLLWQSMPDEALLATAEQGGLATKDGVAAEARRMLKDPKGKRTIEFFTQWLDIDRLANMQRDPAVFPDYSPELAQLLAQESKTFIDHVVWDEAGSFETLMTAPYSFLNGALAAHYGVEGPTGSDFEQVDMEGRAGLLTLGGVIAAHDKPTRTSIVLRGLHIRTDFLCQTVGAPPPDVVPSFPPATEGLSQVERLAEHRKNPSCAACHNMMDPLGSTFEGFDAVGRARTKDEQGKPIVSSSEVAFTDDANGPVSGPVELAGRLAQSEQVRACFQAQAFRFFYGRAEAAEDSCSQQQINAAFESSGHSIVELLVALTQTDAFLYRPTNTAGGGS